MNNKARLSPRIALMMVILTSLGCESTSQLSATATPANTFTPAATLTPTSTPTPIPPPDISNAKIFLEELPAGFEELTPEEFGMNPADLKDENFEPEEVFIYINSTDFQIIMGFNFLLADKIDRIGFDTELNNPDILMESFLGGLGADEVSNQKVLDGMDDIGEARVAMSMDAKMEGLTMSMSFLVFRRDVVGGMILSMHFEGQEPTISIHELGSIFDKNVKSTLGITP